MFERPNCCPCLAIPPSFSRRLLRYYRAQEERECEKERQRCGMLVDEFRPKPGASRTEPTHRGCPEGVGTSGPHDFKSPTFASISRKVVTQPVLSTHAPHRASMTEGQVRVQITPIVINQVNYIAFSDLHSAK